jgi:tetratricopeptide (TPR) repeat protein
MDREELEKLKLPPLEDILGNALDGFWGVEKVSYEDERESNRLSKEGHRLIFDGESHRATEVLNRSLVLNTNNSLAYLYRTMSRFELGDINGALEDINKFIQLFSDLEKSSFSYSWRGKIKEKLGDYSGALADYNHSLDINKNDAGAYKSRAKLRLQIGDLNGALSDCNTAMKLHPDFHSHHSLRSEINCKLGNVRQAKDDIKWAKRLNVGNYSFASVRNINKYFKWKELAKEVFR